MPADSKPCTDLTHLAWNVRSGDYVGLHSREEYNAAALHTRDLIVAAIELLKLNQHAPALFLAITSFEEIAKIKAGHTRSRDQNVKTVTRSKDPLFRHSDKHKIAVDPILLIGSRLADIIGKSRVDTIFADYANGSLSNLRERSLYFSRDEDGLKIPSNEVTVDDACEHILIAIEMFDDYFDFMTNEVSVARDTLKSLFPVVARIYKRM